MSVPFRIGVMQLTMEPLDEILHHASVMDDAGFDTLWLAEAYPWWRKHAHEARSATAISAVVARETNNIAVGWGIISPYTRHPIQVAMDARVTQEAAGDGRFYLGFGASKILMKEVGDPGLPLTAVRETIEIVRPILEGKAVDYEGRVFEAHVPAMPAETDSPRSSPPIYMAGTGPKMQQLAGEIADGLLTASITTPGFIRHAIENVRVGAARSGRSAESVDIGSTIVASINRDRDKGRDGAREIAGMYLANKVQNIQGSADVLLDEAGLSFDEIAPIAEAMERGGRLAAKEKVTDDILDKCPSDRGHSRGLHRSDQRIPCRRLHSYHAGAVGAPTAPPNSNCLAGRSFPMSATEAIAASIDRDRLVATASELVGISSPTGRELEAATYLQGELAAAGLDAGLQHVEEGRANAVGWLRGSGSGHSLMFNGHLDTSYSGEEPWLTGAGYKPDPIVRDGLILGLGIMNMKGLRCLLRRGGTRHRRFRREARR